MVKSCLLVFALSTQLLVAGCGGGNDGGEGSGYDPSLPSGELSIDEPTTEPTYTTFQDSVTLTGTRSPAVSIVTWANLTTGATGQGAILDYPDICCFLFTCWDCIRYQWGAASLPLQSGENQIRVYGNGTYADGINVTLAPSLDMSGHVLFNGNGEFNVKLTLTSTTNPAVSYSTTTDHAGYYRFRYIPVDTYLLQPEDLNFVSSPCISFTPASSEISLSGSFDFVASRSLATLSGRVTDAVSGYGVYAARLTLSSPGSSNLAQHVANQYGDYSFTCVPDGSYTVTPTADPFFGYAGFTPATRSVTIIGGMDAPNQDFHGYR